MIITNRNSKFVGRTARGHHGDPDLVAAANEFLGLKPNNSPQESPLPQHPPRPESQTSSFPNTQPAEKEMRRLNPESCDKNTSQSLGCPAGAWRARGPVEAETSQLPNNSRRISPKVLDKHPIGEGNAATCNLQDHRNSGPGRLKRLPGPSPKDPSETKEVPWRSPARKKLLKPGPAS